MSATPVRAAHRAWAYLALLALATLSLLLGTQLHWYWGDVAISLTIAAGKTFLVLWFFMDLAEQPFQARLAVLIAVTLLVLLVSLTVADVATRRVMPMKSVPEPSESFYQR
ncbi:MAG TPA: cytochrome C oxidase subunit IV family protein [Polyangia bacterium]|nr:cytochrome C oxidase subunit IV family protein [Polyangia bacterium]